MLGRGWDDFAAYRTDVVLLCFIHPLLGIVLVRLVFGYGVLPLLFPVASGFALVGPAATVGLYEMSRRREQGHAVSWLASRVVYAPPLWCHPDAVGVGFLFAVLVLTISAISFPPLLARSTGLPEAIGASVRAVVMNPAPMAAWGLVVVADLVAGSIPLFRGLAVVLPVLGHATWHLNRLMVRPAAVRISISRRQSGVRTS